MEFRNLEINILYHMGCAHKGRKGEEPIAITEVLEEFSDIPESEFISAIDTMAAEGLISTNSSHSRIRITEQGNNKLQTSIARLNIEMDQCLFDKPKEMEFIKS